MRGALLAALLILPPISALADPEIPDTNAGRPLKLWLQIMNGGDSSLISTYNATYHRNIYLDEVEVFRVLHGDGYRLERFEQNEPNKLVAILVEKDTGDRTRRTFAMDPTDPTRFLDAGGQKIPPQRLPMAASLMALSNRGDTLAAKDFFSGGVLVAQNGKVLLEKTWGVADRTSNKPITADSQFRMGSMNKMFTAVAALQLVSKGKLSLDGTIGTYLPDYPNKDIANKVTIRMLLTHTGGTGDFFGPEFEAHRLSLRSVSDYVALFGNRAPEFPPGTQYRYSNYGFMLLGRIVEVVSGMSYFDYVQKSIFAPLGMRATGSQPEVERVPNRVNGYTRRDGKWISNADTLPWAGSPAGGGYSTLGDMLKFAEGLRAGKLLPPDLFAAAITNQGSNRNYGMGFNVKDEGALLHYGHGGGAPGQNGDLRVYPALGRVVVALSNLDPETANAMADFYEERMPLN